MPEIKALDAHIVLLTHAPTDLTVLHSALAQLPQEFPPVTGVNLQALESEAQMATLLAHELAAAQIIILRVLGRLGSVPGFAELVDQARRQGRHLIAISGTGEPDPELAVVSTVSPDVLQQALTYFQAGGSDQPGAAAALSVRSSSADRLWLRTGAGFARAWTISPRLAPRRRH